MTHKYIVDDVLHFTEEDARDEFNTVIKFVYENIKLDYDKMAKENKNLIKGDEYDHEEDYNWECRGMQYDCDGEHTVKYRYTISEKLDNYEIDDDDKNEYIKRKILNELVEYFLDKTKKLDDLKFTFSRIRVDNMRGINEDPRGVRKLDWHLQYNYEVEVLPENNNANITFQQFIDALYDIKSHKFENWYELYCGCDVLVDYTDMFVSCNYDHCS